MFIRMQLVLPRDARYVGLTRNLSHCILSELDIALESLDDLQVAMSEACANAVRHATGTDDYTVSLTLTDGHCEVEVIDVGQVSNPSVLPGGDASLPEAESGRGFLLMRALTDDFEFQRQDDGTRVRLVKRLPGLSAPDAEPS